MIIIHIEKIISFVKETCILSFFFLLLGNRVVLFLTIQTAIAWFTPEHSKVPSFACLRWLFWHAPSTLKSSNQVRPCCCILEMRLLADSILFAKILTNIILVTSVVSSIDLRIELTYFISFYSFLNRNMVLCPSNCLVTFFHRVPLCMLGNFSWFFCHMLILFKIIFSKNSFKNAIRVSNCFHRLSAVYKSLP